MQAKKRIMAQFNYAKKIAQLVQIDPSDVFLYRKGRIGLYVLLRALDVKPGDEVILSAYTCRAVANTILSLGAKPIYADIREETFTIDLKSIQALKTSKTKIIISQNTFGLSYGVDEIDKWARENHIIHIEDCAHGFGGSFHKKPNGRKCDAAFYSTHFSKPFNTGIGGILIVNNSMIKEKVINVNTTIKDAPLFDSILLPILYYWQEHKVLHIISHAIWKVFSLYNKYKIHSENNFNREIITFASIKQIEYGLSKIDNIPRLNSIRKQQAENYSRFLKCNHKLFVSDYLKDDHLFLYYPILVKDKFKVLKLAKHAGVNVNGMFTIKQHPEQLGIDYSHLPVTVYVSKHLINLPTSSIENSTAIAFLNLIYEEIL